MTSPFCDAQGGTIPDEQILGSGGSAVVILRDGVAVKTPLRALWSTEYEIQANIDSLRREQDVYRRLQPACAPHDECDARSRGVVRCLQLAPDAIHLAHMPHGNLRTYLATSKQQPSRAHQLQWCIEIAQALNYIHDRCVLVADIASRNVLVGADLSVKLCDFSEASLLPLGTDMRTADDNGYTVKIDIGLLGAVMYEVATGSIECKVDLYRDNSPSDGRAYWPARSTLPDTHGVAFGDIVDGCWQGRFRDAGELSRALEALCGPQPSAYGVVRDSQQRAAIAVIGALGGLAAIIFMTRKQRFLNQ